MPLFTRLTKLPKNLKMPVTIANLPLPSSTLQHSLFRLDPDPALEDHTTNHKHVSQSETPCVDQRRARTFGKGGHWAYVTPLPIEFPYHMPQDADSTRPGNIEDWLHEYDVWSNQKQAIGANGLRALTSDRRSAWQPELLGVCKPCVQQCLPHLKVGNAFDYQRRGPGGEEKNEETTNLDEAATELLDVVSGRKVLLGEKQTYLPWSLRYAGKCHCC